MTSVTSPEALPLGRLGQGVPDRMIMDAHRQKKDTPLPTKWMRTRPQLVKTESAMLRAQESLVAKERALAASCHVLHLRPSRQARPRIRSSPLEKLS